MNPLNDVICTLLETPFLSLSEDDQKDTLAYGRPTPIIDVHLRKELKSKGKSYNILFKKSWYMKYEWLCGSHYLQKLYCWTCLLVGVKKHTWNFAGFHDYMNASRGLRNHDDSAEHIRSTLHLKALQTYKNTLASALKENFKLHAAEYNENVRLNRLVMESVIDTVLYLSKQEHTFSEHDGSATTLNHGNFKELLLLLISRSSLEIKFHFDKIKAVIDAELETIHNEITDCISECIQERIRGEITNAEFFSVEIDDTTNITQSSLCCITVRLINMVGEVVERFMGFHNVGADRTSETLYELLDTILGPFNVKEKLVAQCYDGACVMWGHVDELQQKVKEVAPQAVFVHSLANHLDVVLQQSFNRIKKCRMFFATVSGIPLFFHHSAKTTYLMETIIGRRIPKTTDTQWSSHSKVLPIIVEEWDGLKTVFESILSDIESDQTAITLSRNFLKETDDFEFAFLAVVFNVIIKFTSVLFDVLQEQSLNIDACVLQVRVVTQLIESNRNDESFAGMFNVAQNMKDSLGRKFSEVNEEGTLKTCRALYFEIVESIVTELNVRFRDLNKLIFVALADTSKFGTYSTDVFPVLALNSLQEHYPNQFKKIQRLRCELELIYSNEDYNNMCLPQLLPILCKNDVHRDVFREAYKLFSLILTLPSTNVSSERNFSCLNRIKTHWKSSMSQERLSSLANVSIQQDILGDVKGLPFYLDILEKYAALKERKLDLIYIL